MKHTKKIALALALIAAASILLAGCAATAAPQEQAPGASLGGGYGRAADAKRTVALGAGSRGNGGYGGNGISGGYGLESVDDCSPAYSGESAYPAYTPTASDLTLSVSGYGSAGATADASLSLADMLTYAIQDEYAAHAEYDRILDSYGDVRPYANILRAESAHIDALLPLFAEYGVAAPADDGAEHSVLPESLTSAYQTGVNAEVMNIAMYELFLEQNLPADVRAVFESLMRASENHLRAFQNRL